MQLPNPGQWFQRRYELGELLGKGGFAAVYRAVDHDVGREVAIKILMPDHNGYEPGLVQRFMREGRIVAGLQDPHTITMFDFGRTETDLLFMVFEFVPGSDLSKLLIRTGPMPEREVTHVLQQLLSALREAHNAGILHRDIKPANVLVHSYMDDDRRVKLLDFGIAKPTMQEGEVDELEESTKSGMSPGTPRYMSPEQIYGDELTAASDIFSLGLVAYEMLSGKPAVQGRTTKETLLHQLSDKPIQLPPFLRVSPELRAMVDRMTMKRPLDRFQNTQEVMQHLTNVTNITMSRPIPLPVGTDVVRPVTEAILSPKAKDNLTTIGLVAIGVLVAAALFVPLVKVVQRAIDRAAPMVPVPVVERPDLENPEPAAVTAVDPVVVEDEPMSGCGEVPPHVGQAAMSVKMGVMTRKFVTYVPKAYDPDHEHPVVLFFHDSRPAAAALGDSHLMEVAEKERFILVAPMARISSEQKNPWSRKAHIDTVRAIMAEVKKDFCVDDTRLFAVGHGAAGEMAESVACEIPLSGIATTSYLPLIDRKLCTPVQPTPQIQLLGKDNIEYTPKGTSACMVNTVTMGFDRKSQLGFDRNGCEGGDMPWSEFKHGQCVTRRCPDAPFVACLVDDAYEFINFSIPFLDVKKVVGNRCQPSRTQFDVAGTIWTFFDQHGVPLDR